MIDQQLNAFKSCQLCGSSSDDICEFRMWQRCDSNDKPIEDYLIACQSDACRKIIDDDPLLFIEVPWSQGGPGRFMLICGDCPHRSEYSCQHPDLKTNGGEGLLVHFTPTPISMARICFSDGTSYQAGPPATRCVGNEKP